MKTSKRKSATNTNRRATSGKFQASSGSALKRTANKNRATATPSPILKAVHETAGGLYRAGVINKATMREFDAACVPRVREYTPTQIKGIRNRCGASQPIFAQFMNVTVSSVQKWETGQRRPDAAALKLLNIVDAKGFDVLMSTPNTRVSVDKRAAETGPTSQPPRAPKANRKTIIERKVYGVARSPKKATPKRKNAG